MSKQFKIIIDIKEHMIIKNNDVQIDFIYLKNENNTPYIRINIYSLKTKMINKFYLNKSGGFIPIKYKEIANNFLIMHKLTWGQ